MQTNVSTLLREFPKVKRAALGGGTGGDQDPRGQSGAFGRVSAGAQPPRLNARNLHRNRLRPVRADPAANRLESVTMKLILVTKDRLIRKSRLVATIW